MSAPQVVMFDLDGTLVDTMFHFADLAAELMSASYGDALSWARSRYLETSGVPFAQQLELIHPEHEANLRTSQEFERRKRAITRLARLSPETLRALEALRALGLKVVLSSNTGQEFVDEFVATAPFSFDLALGFDPARGLAKGSPHVSLTLREFGVEPAEVWFVGDSLKDGELAAATGLTFCGRVGTFRAADFRAAFPQAWVIESLGELLGRVEQSRGAERNPGPRSGHD